MTVSEEEIQEAIPSIATLMWWLVVSGNPDRKSKLSSFTSS